MMAMTATNNAPGRVMRLTALARIPLGLRAGSDAGDETALATDLVGLRIGSKAIEL